MYPVFETIRIENGQAMRLEWHRQRMQRSALALGFEAELVEAIPLQELSKQVADTGRWKLRVDYGPAGWTYRLSPYRLQPLHRLFVVNDDSLQYPFKFSDRSSLEKFNTRLSEGSDVLFVRDGLLTDTVYANVLLWDGSRWHTPATPLLEGTHRAQLLAQGKVQASAIRLQDLEHFERITLISAMLDPGEREMPAGRIEKAPFLP
jgi:4-amino-4-deoxychorismate lyase